MSGRGGGVALRQLAGAPPRKAWPSAGLPRVGAVPLFPQSASSSRVQLLLLSCLSTLLVGRGREAGTSTVQIVGLAT